MTVLLGYIDHCIAIKNIMLVTFHYNVCAPSNTESINPKLYILLAAYTRLAGSYVVQCLMVTKLFLKSTATLWSAPLPVAK